MFTTHSEYRQLPAAARALFPMIADVPFESRYRYRFLRFSFRQVEDPEVTQQEVRSMLNRVELPALHPAHRGFSRRYRSRPGQTSACISRIARMEVRMKRRSSTAESTPCWQNGCISGALTISTLNAYRLSKMYT